MGIMPHESVAAALGAALALDILFWPQLPRVSYSEDMYVQAMENFPGVVIDREKQRIHVDSTKFMEDLPEYLENESSPDLFRLTADSSVVYRRFLEMDLSGYKAIRGQMMSPVSVGLTITDENGKPIVASTETIKAIELSGISDVTFRRNSLTGRIEVVPIPNKAILNDMLHKNV